VTDSVALAGFFAVPLTGFVTTFAVKVDLVQVSFPSEVAKTTEVRDLTLAFSTAFGATAGPPAFPVVSTWTGVAADAAAGSAATSAAATMTPI
jgi:hypothetical protein